MKEQTSSVLLVDDDGNASSILARALKATGLNAPIHIATESESALRVLEESHPSAIVLDLSLDEAIGPESGFAMLQKIREQDSTCRIIVLTGHGGVEFGVRSLKLGASSFVEKPADPAHLSALLVDCLRQAALMRAHLEISASTHPRIEIVGFSSAIEKVRESVHYAGRTGQAILITGETGTGKGLVARAIHASSERSSHSFVRYQPNFGSADLVSSELFGHTRGAFTGATQDRKGLIREAHQGTLFLDEIDEFPLETQVTLLNVLQEKRFRPVGATEEEEVDFRLICASNQDLERCLEEGKLRSDFFHRIAHFRIEIPPLRERSEDLEPLARVLINRLRNHESVSVQSIDAKAISTLTTHSWPGNVRELESVIEGAAYRAQFEGRATITPPDLQFHPGEIPRADLSFHERVEAFKVQLIQNALKECDGNQARAAEELKLDRSSLRRILSRHGLLAAKGP